MRFVLTVSPFAKGGFAWLTGSSWNFCHLGAFLVDLHWTIFTVLALKLVARKILPSALELVNVIFNLHKTWSSVKSLNLKLLDIICKDFSHSVLQISNKQQGNGKSNPSRQAVVAKTWRSVDSSWCLDTVCLHERNWIDSGLIKSQFWFFSNALTREELDWPWSGFTVFLWIGASATTLLARYKAAWNFVFLSQQHLVFCVRTSLDPIQSEPETIQTKADPVTLVLTGSAYQHSQ